MEQRTRVAFPSIVSPPAPFADSGRSCRPFNTWSPPSFFSFSFSIAFLLIRCLNRGKQNKKEATRRKWRQIKEFKQEKNEKQEKIHPAGYLVGICFSCPIPLLFENSCSLFFQPPLRREAVAEFFTWTEFTLRKKQKKLLFFFSVWSRYHV